MLLTVLHEFLSWLKLKTLLASL